ncbi:PRELI domain containing protein 3A isoform X11 [Equus asinus]|uniref:PRELI domain containing protein 3A isoform X11 n=1 Tax=Equus asinus TaxID=9793 RepID=UPI0038F756D2
MVQAECSSVAERDSVVGQGLQRPACPPAAEPAGGEPAPPAAQHPHPVPVCPRAALVPGLFSPSCSSHICPANSWDLTKQLLSFQIRFRSVPLNQQSSLPVSSHIAGHHLSPQESLAESFHTRHPFSAVTSLSKGREALEWVICRLNMELEGLGAPACARA